MATDRSVYVAVESGSAEIDGQTYTFTKDVTLVRAGHPLLKGRSHLFKKVEQSVHYEVEQATAAPGEKRSR